MHYLIALGLIMFLVACILRYWLLPMLLGKGDDHDA